MARRLKGSLCGGRGRLASSTIVNRQTHEYVGAWHLKRSPGSGPDPNRSLALPASQARDGGAEPGPTRWGK